jgi:hypothetical protein
VHRRRPGHCNDRRKVKLVHPIATPANGLVSSATARKVFAAVLISTGAVFALLLIVLNGVLEKHRPAIQQKISEAFGDAASFDSLGISWTGLGLSARNLRIADDPRFAATPFIQSAEVRIRLRWLALIRGRIEIEKFILLEPEIQIIRNEATSVNILERERSEAHPAATFFGAALKVTSGRVEYIDRSVKEPVEIHIQDLDMELTAPRRDGRRAVKIAATVFHPEGHEQNVTVQGWVGAGSSQNHWSQTALDLRLRAEAFLLGQLIRAVPVLREQAGEILDVTGPITLSARLQGSVRKPRLNHLLLKGPFFGSNRTNLRLAGNLDLTQAAELADGHFEGDLTLDPVAYERLKKLPFLRDMLPGSLAAEGPLRVVTGFEGTLEKLRMRAQVQGKRSEISYGDWVKKPAGTPGSVQLAVIFLKGKTIFEDSLVDLHNLRLRFSGFLEPPPRGQLFLRLHTEGVELAGWEHVLPPLSHTQLRGRSRFALAVRKPLGASESSPEIWGELDLTDVEVEDIASENKPLIEKITGHVSFGGKEARLAGFSFNFGSSSISLQGVLRNYTAPVLRYNLRSTKLNLSDLGRLPAKNSDAMIDVHSTGEIKQGGGGFTVRGRLSSPSGALQGFPYRKFDSDLEWSAGGLNLERFSLQTLGGAVTGSALLQSRGSKTSFTLRPAAKNLDLGQIVPKRISGSVPEIDGAMNLEAHVTGHGKDWSEAWRAMQGNGRVVIQRGVIRNFNFAENVLSNISGLPGIGRLLSARPASAKNPVIERRDTPFEAAGSSFTIGGGKIELQDLILTAPEFEIRGDGSFGPERALRLSARLAMSSQFSRELAKEHTNIRFLMDREGRLVVPFRVEGTPERPQLRPDLRRLAESIQRGLLGRPAGDRPDQRKKTR